MAKRNWHFIHTFIFAAYPSITLLASNIGQVNIGSAVRPLIVSLLLALGITVIAFMVLRSTTTASLVASTIIVLFFSYGHIYNLIEGIELVGINIGRHRYLGPLWFVIGIPLNYFIIRSQPREYSIRVLSFASILLIAFPVTSLFLFEIRQIQRESSLPLVEDSQKSVSSTNRDAFPHIFYVILDEYPRQDVILSQYSYDNAGLIRQLEDLGFFIASESMSNYASTDLSLASSLNMDYLPALLESLDPTDTDRSHSWNLIQNNRVRAFLENRGYEIAAFQTGYAWSQWEDAEHYLGPSQGFFSRASLKNQLSYFEILLIRQTFILFFEDIANIFPNTGIPKLERRAKITYDQVNYIFEELPQIATWEDPTFAFAHIIAPHPPYTYSVTGEYIGDAILEEFGPDGEALLYDHNIEGHRRSIEYISSQINDLVPEILEYKTRDTIIILQADTGPPGGSPRDRMSILYAVFLDQFSDGNFEDNTSPVNTFRVIFNLVFDQEFDLLDDIAFYSAYNTPYEFHIIENQ